MKYKLINPIFCEFFKPVEPPIILTEVKNHTWDLEANKKLYSFLNNDGIECKIALTEKRLKYLTEEI